MFVVKKSSIRKIPDPGGFSDEVYQTHKEEIITHSKETLSKNRRGGKLFNSYFEASITQIQKPDNNTIR